VLPDPNAVLPGSKFYSPLAEEGLNDIESCTCISVYYYNPAIPENSEFMAALLPGARMPPKALTHDDYLAMQNNGRQRGGRSNNYNSRYDSSASRYV
jgi:hypothetical protein